MKNAWLLALCLAAGWAQAGEMFRWVDADGKVHYTDQPPPAAAKKVEEKKLGGGPAADGAQLSYATREAMKKYPVTLYITDCGEACNSAREHLSRRGVPFTAKNPQTSQADADALMKAVGALYVPVMVVGTVVSKGYEKGAWDAALDTAGYPQQGAVLKKPAQKADGQVEKPAAPPEPPAPAHPWAKGK